MPLFSKFQTKKRKCQIIPSKQRIYNAYKVTTKSFKIRIPSIECSLSLSRVGSVRLGNFKETLQIFQISHDIFERNSEVVVSPNLQISNFRRSTFIFKISPFRIISRFSTQENLDFQQLLQFQKKKNFKTNNIKIFYLRKF